MTAAVLAVDGGNSKTDVVLLDPRGAVVGAARGPGSNHSHSDHDTVMRLIDSLVGEASGGSRRPVADVAVLCLAGADYASDERRLAASAAPYGWADELQIRNDGLAMLRAGTDSAAAIAVICGAGINCVGIAADGRSYRFPALGDISGDWGGGYDLGLAALVGAIRAQDGRGPRTSLAQLVPRHFGVARPSSVVYAMHLGRIDRSRLVELAPLVFEAADSGDAVAAGIVDRLATELVAMVTAVVRRLRLAPAEIDVVLGGGVLTAGHSRLLDPLASGILAAAPNARLSPLHWAPVAGAALLGFAAIGRAPSVDVRRAVADAFGARSGR